MRILIQYITYHINSYGDRASSRLVSHVARLYLQVYLLRNALPTLALVEQSRRGAATGRAEPYRTLAKRAIGRAKPYGTPLVAAME